MVSKILVIDEDLQFSNLLTRMLLLENYSVWRSFDIKTSFDILDNETIDIILLDDVLEEGENDYYVKKIKDEYPDVHIIILSAHPDIRNCVHSIKNGAEDYIVKDKDITKLLPLLISLFNDTAPATYIKPFIEVKRVD